MSLRIYEILRNFLFSAITDSSLNDGDGLALATKTCRDMAGRRLNLEQWPGYCPQGAIKGHADEVPAEVEIFEPLSRLCVRYRMGRFRGTRSISQLLDACNWLRRSRAALSAS